VILPPVKRVGHGGASALARANTLASFDAALAHGIDMVEFDVRGCAGRLVLAHSKLDERRRPLSLERALAHLARPAFADVELNVDLKHPGCEAATLDALRRFALLERTLISSQRIAVLDAVRRLEPAARTGISVGGRIARRSQRWGAWRPTVLHALAQGRFRALMAQHALVDAPLHDEVRERGAELYAWTVRDRATLQRLAAVGVSGIVTDDPRLFSPATGA
jgi:glycerophosphoryl diester phosphodiesterase